MCSLFTLCIFLYGIQHQLLDPYKVISVSLANQGQVFTSFSQTFQFEVTLLLEVIQISCVLAFV